MEKRTVLRVAAFGLALAMLFALCLSLVSMRSGAALRYGSTGETVRRVQTKLKQWGYYSGPVDGIYGSKTVAAVKYFQRKNGLAVDGIVGAKTLAALGISASADSGNRESELEMLARIISAEGRGEPYAGQVAIGAVVMNRVRSASFPNTVAGVIYQTGAFEAVSNGSFYQPATASCVKAAQEAYNGADPTGGCLYYYNPAKTSNHYMLAKPVLLRIGDHVFCK